MPEFITHSWKPNPRGVEAYLNDHTNKHPVFCVASSAIGDYDKVTTLLYEPLIWADPDYRRGSQAIGSCVAWGMELACTVLVAKQAMKRRRASAYVEVATEPIYGGCRVEVFNRMAGGWGDGAYGASAANWVRRYGVLLRRDYSVSIPNRKGTGIAAHDLRNYSGKKEKNWGNYGCGGQNDKGKLDALSRLHPVKTTSQVHSFDDVAKAIAGARCPVTIASDYGTTMRRDKDGFCRWNKSWSHQMVLVGVRFGRKPGALCAQSWGPNVSSGKHYPNDMPANIKGFTWWIPADDIDKICRSGDCHAIGDIDGWKRDRFDWRAVNLGLTV